MARRGKKTTQLDDPRVTTLLTAIQNGNFIETACSFAGLAPSTIYRWIERGNAEKKRIEQGLPANDAETQYLDLCEAVEKARAIAVMRNVQIIQQAANSGTWQAAAWYLERTQPNQFGRRLQAEVQTTVSVQDLEQKMLELLGEQDTDTVG
mgnify:CR=1 FL=1